MITGAAQADAALLIVDASEGVRDQTRRHGYLLHLLGVRQVAVVINKMDRIGFDAARFRERSRPRSAATLPREKLRDFVVANNIPVNPLHTKGYASIGCAPCTRPIAPGEPERAGRWWWEDEEKKECGLHVNRV
jgi:hypothetical protein